jgi:hypothetical protein
MPPEIDLLAIERGAITAPAGCGKTELIAAAAAAYDGAKPLLILTHTNAGVAALRGRLRRAGIPGSRARVSTLDGWAMRLIGTFPQRSGHPPDLLALRTPRTDYPAIRQAALGLLASGDLDDVISASYARLIVDEYQDCIQPQHQLVCQLSQRLPTCVLGDPMQAIFGFAGRLAHWTRDTCQHFPPAGQLQTPWRWRNAGTEPFGQWLLQVRERLSQGQGIDLRAVPPEVRWVQMGHADDYQRQLEAARTPPVSRDGGVLILGQSTNPDSHGQIASQTPGASAIEGVELKTLVAFANTLALGAPNVLEVLIGFGQGVLTRTDTGDLLRRINVLRGGTARTPPTPLEALAMRFAAAPSYRAAADVLEGMKRQPNARAHRPAAFYGALKALRLADERDILLAESALAVREEYRYAGRTLPARAVGSTLLLKGLEAEVAVILNADDLDAVNLYVAMTRGSKRLVICSRRAVLCA